MVERGFYYRRYMWDWLFIPVSIGGILQITPGLAWLVTDVNSPSRGIDQTSIRPVGVLTIGLRIPFSQLVALRVDDRTEIAFADRAKLPNGSKLNLTGSFVSAFAGFDLEF